MVNWLLQKVQNNFDGEMTVILSIGAGKIIYPYSNKFKKIK